jgi:hypothetical protein
MNRKPPVIFIVGLLLGGALGAVLTTIFSSAGLEYVISFLSKLFIAIFLGGALGNIMLGAAIGLLGGLFLVGGATAVFRRARQHQSATKQQPTYSVT